MTNPPRHPGQTERELDESSGAVICWLVILVVFAAGIVVGKLL